MSEILLSTAYLPPIEYFSHIPDADIVFIEKEENYVKQSYRNRCLILSAHGPQKLSVPVFGGSLHKIRVKDIRIDYSKRWQQVHIGAIRASYGCSPFFLHYFSDIEKEINKKYNYLIDLNSGLIELVFNILGIEKKIFYTDKYLYPCDVPGDYRYSITPKKKSEYKSKEYYQVFSEKTGFVPGLSIIDLIFNIGPDSAVYL